jgi:two-component system LytT family sensor kinase
VSVTSPEFAPALVTDVGARVRFGRLFGVAVLAASLLAFDVLRVFPGAWFGKAVLLCFAHALVKALLWAAAATLVFALCRRVPPDGRPRLWALGVHLTAWLGIASAVTVLSHPLQSRISPALFAALPAEAPRRLFASWTGGPREQIWSSLQLALPWDLLTYWAVFAAVLYSEWAAAAQERERRGLALARSLEEARLAALETQLRPHFLFNALNTISALLGSSPDAARSVARRLRALLARLMSTNRSPVQSLAEELALLDDFVAIQKVRFGDRLTVQIDVASDCLTCLVPSLILQPLVENAVRHGAGSRTAATRIVVSASRCADQLALTVRDDGPGSAWDGLESGGNAGVGLRNTMSRLERLYGDRHHFRFVGSAAPWGGVQVQIRFPLQIAGAGEVHPPDQAARVFPAPRPDARWWLAPWLLFIAIILVQDLGTWAAIGSFYAAAPAGWRIALVMSSCGVAALVLLFPLVCVADRFISTRVSRRAARVALHVLGALSLCLAKAAVGRVLALASGLHDVPPVWFIALSRFYADLLHYGLMVGICHALDRRQLRHAHGLRAARLCAQLAQARLETARLQLDPDFLFATLDRLDSLIHLAPDEADQLVAQLGDHLRQLLRRRGAET